MKPLSGPSEAHHTKNGTFKQSYRPIVVMGEQSAAGPHISHRIHDMSNRESLI